MLPFHRRSRLKKVPRPASATLREYVTVIAAAAASFWPTCWLTVEWHEGNQCDNALWSSSELSVSDQPGSHKDNWVTSENEEKHSSVISHSYLCYFTHSVLLLLWNHTPSLCWDTTLIIYLSRCLSGYNMWGSQRVNSTDSNTRL